MNTIDVLAVAVFTGCYCSEAALVPPSLLFTLSLFIFHYLTSLFSVCNLTHSFIYSTFLLVSFVFFFPHSGARGPVSPHMPPLLSPTVSPLSPSRVLLVNHTREEQKQSRVSA